MQRLRVAAGSCAKSAGIGADVTGSTAIGLQSKELKMCLKTIMEEKCNHITYQVIHLVLFK